MMMTKSKNSGNAENALKFTGRAISSKMRRKDLKICDFGFIIPWGANLQ
jgi:hypothetical protein